MNCRRVGGKISLLRRATARPMQRRRPAGWQPWRLGNSRWCLSTPPSHSQTRTSPCCYPSLAPSTSSTTALSCKNSAFTAAKENVPRGSRLTIERSSLQSSSWCHPSRARSHKFTRPFDYTKVVFVSALANNVF